MSSLDSESGPSITSDYLSAAGHRQSLALIITCHNCHYNTPLWLHRSSGSSVCLLPSVAIWAMFGSLSLCLLSFSVFLCRLMCLPLFLSVPSSRCGSAIFLLCVPLDVDSQLWLPLASLATVEIVLKSICCLVLLVSTMCLCSGVSLQLPLSGFALLFIWSSACMYDAAAGCCCLEYPSTPLF